MKWALAALALAAAVDLSAQTTRIASDFEIRQMEALAAKQKDFVAQIAAHMNLGDVRNGRGERTIARREFATAASIAARERAAARGSSSLSRYVTATLYAALAESRLGNRDGAFELAEEAARYGGAEAKTWNLVAAVMGAIGADTKAVSAARNAVSIAEVEVRGKDGADELLDLSVYRLTLASALERTGTRPEARTLLESVVATLTSSRFDDLRRTVARSESFEIYSTARGDAAAYLSALHRARLQLAALHERSGDTAAARRLYQDVLRARTDDPTALAALARLASNDEERMTQLAAALDANPFSIETIRSYRAALAIGARPPEAGSAGTGERMRAILWRMHRGEAKAAREAIGVMLRDFPENEVVQYLAAINDLALGDRSLARSRSIVSSELRREIEAAIAGEGAVASPAWLRGKDIASPTAAELKTLLTLLVQERLEPEDRASLDRVVLTNAVRFDPPSADAPQGTTVFGSGTIEGVPFVFAQPTAFRGSLGGASSLRLTYRVLGATERDAAPVLLLEPLNVEAGQ